MCDDIKQDYSAPALSHGPKGLRRSQENVNLALLDHIDMASSSLGRLRRVPEATNLGEIMQSKESVHVIAPSSSVCDLDKMGDRLVVKVQSREHNGKDAAESNEIMHDAPRLTRSKSVEIVQRITSAHSVMEFSQFQRFVLLSYALRHNLVTNGHDLPTSTDHDNPYPFSPQGIDSSAEPEDVSPSIFVCAFSQPNIDAFRKQLWAPDDLEECLSAGDLESLERALHSTRAEIGVFIIAVTPNDLEHLKTEVGHDHKSKKDAGSETICGCYVEDKCKGWRLVEKRFGDKAFCVLVQDKCMTDFFGLHQDLPADMLPTYDVGHIVMWPRDQLVGFNFQKLLANVEDQLPYSWPHDILCSPSQWKRIVFETQLKHLIKVTRIHSDSKKNLRRPSMSKDDVEKEPTEDKSFLGHIGCTIC